MRLEIDIGNNIFDNIIYKKNINEDKKIIKLPMVPEIYSPSAFDFYFQRLDKKIVTR